MTPDQAEAAAYQADGAGDPAAWLAAVTAAQAAQFDATATAARAAALEGVALRCVTSSCLARFWREVLAA